MKIYARGLARPRRVVVFSAITLQTLPSSLPGDLLGPRTFEERPRRANLISATRESNRS
ncbi:hypothetical protein [Paraburkholderia sp. BL6665CI2N2]|uniref:hypothetical protein n=1 Tax=Paraburkholderia sp. BL6665CI2N2 TaxID=1938806 RepID=UPI0014170C98|nr:hypothetical protein [Paraburkholderia sp. BL6665CI2N2]